MHCSMTKDLTIEYRYLIISAMILLIGLFADINLEYDQQSYVILLTLDELLYQEVPGYIEVGRYTTEDYTRFRNDRSVSVKIYDNRNIEVFDVGLSKGNASDFL